MTFTVYSKPGCPYCVKLEEVLNHLEIDSVIYTLDEDFTRDQFYSEFGEGSTFPQVVFGSQILGGATDTINFLKEQNLCCQD